MVKSRKIVIRLKGGLGNQLFIYSFAFALNRKYFCDIYFDCFSGFFRDRYKRKPLLENIIGDIKHANLYLILIFYFVKLFPNLSKELFGANRITESSNRQLIFISSDLISKFNIIYIEGYFQSPFYFKTFESELSKKVSQKIFDIEFDSTYFTEIKNSNSVSIHVRRVNYDNLLDFIYYQNAINLMMTLQPSVKLFVFSDDIEWCVHKFQSYKEIIYVRNKNNELFDFILMSHCKHHIIANSSFSWWSAWLSPFNSKNIIAPRKTQIGVINNFYPDNWILL